MLAFRGFSLLCEMSKYTYNVKVQDHIENLWSGTN
ncbi:hypothetical protein M2326_000811 [Flavobacterium sp. 7A]|nr:hypothetical protein [Flavobacterium sp. 7A]